MINDVFNRNNNKQLSASSRPNWMTLAANYTTPKWGENQWLSYALRDWTLGAVLQYGSGLPIQAPASPGNNNSSTLLRSTYATRIGSAALLGGFQLPLLRPQHDASVESRRVDRYA